MPSHRVVTMDELTQYLHLPEKVVAKQLGICLTSLKKLCRQHGITRWPYRKLKSLDKKIAKAETGSGVGGEDPNALKARAEELKKEKMAVAFTYGLKDGLGDCDSVSGSEAGYSGAEVVTASKAPKPKKTKPTAAVTKTAASAVLMTSSPVAAATPTAPAKKEKEKEKGHQEWPFGKDASGIPTPPEEPIAPQENDIFAEAVADVMADPLMDENGMPPALEWDASHAEESGGEEAKEETPKGATAEVKFNGTPLKGVLQKDKNGGMKMTLMLPNGLSNGLGNTQLAGKVIVSDADMRIASALASVSSPRDALWADTAAHAPARDVKVEDEADHHGPAHPKFDIDEEHHDASFGHELMDSEFFSAMARHSTEHDGEDTVHLDSVDHHDHSREDESPSSLDSVPCSARGRKHDADAEDSAGGPDEKLPLTTITTEGWDEETRLWLSPDTPSKANAPDELLKLKSPQDKDKEIGPTGAAAVILGGKPPKAAESPSAVLVGDSAASASCAGSQPGSLNGLDIASMLNGGSSPQRVEN
mmetsp:Transcript_34679/g.71585  ORF Transcript_34679/g.71585 Transcript_34679/m.71585 type:complete len:533 (-) Transcript_34679:331-1929(-)|eukprot:CAMPEP_0181329524 /NCGR_PEP_ID=MMETSP1101-20121128/23354_1 /TAXON_ID=46948 /ORGANISM="Rhodomonas abbreviata, Strain Caron Lab Isolate" /LENGTH=532 /DNA_ID=CAMNT_0023438603 /DNA_START=645 /DNA_END=2243 /DNA_ORIENTATION=-